MIKRQKLKCLMYTLFILTIIVLCLQAGTGVYQSIVLQIGFSWESSTVTSCSQNYLNLKLTQAKTIISISFVMLCLSFILVVSLFSTLLIGFIRFVSLTSEYDKVEKLHMTQQKTIYDPYFTYRKVATLYILYSVAAITNIVHFASFLSYTIEKTACEGTLPTEPVVIASLSGCSCIFLFVCFIFLMMIILRMHRYFEGEDSVEEEKSIKKEQKVSQKKEKNGEGEKIEMKQIKNEKKQPLLIKSDFNIEKDFETFNKKKSEKEDSKRSNHEEAITYLEYLEKQNTPTNKAKKSFFRGSKTKTKEVEKQIDDTSPLSKYERYEKRHVQEESNLPKSQPYWEIKRTKERKYSPTRQLRKQQNLFLEENSGRSILGQESLTDEREHTRTVHEKKKIKKQESLLLSMIRSKYVD